MISIMLKTFLCLAVVFLFVATTPLEDIAGAFVMLHVPYFLVSIILVTYRYIYLLVEEAGKMHQAYILRHFKKDALEMKHMGSFLGLGGNDYIEGGVIMIQINDVSIVYDHTIIAINHLTTTIHAPVTAIIGENGSGKSTLLTSIVGLHPMAGSILVDGIEVKKENLHTIRKRVGYLFQNPDHQLFMNTVYEDIAFGLVSQGMDQDVVKEKVEAMAYQLHIDDLLARNCAKLSGGQKSLVALAGVLVMEPFLMNQQPSLILRPDEELSIS